MTQLPDGFEIPLHQSLTEPMLLAGVPRQLGIVTLLFTLLTSLALQVWWIGLPVGAAVHAITAALTRYDPHWWAIVRAHLRQPTFLDA
ncbi:MAG: VirB3 family type IV secretion system protein [Planctomycetaceae bacterium]